MGIEPTRSAWKAEVLPLNYIRISVTSIIISLYTSFVKIKFVYYYTTDFDFKLNYNNQSPFFCTAKNV